MTGLLIFVKALGIARIQATFELQCISRSGGNKNAERANADKATLFADRIERNSLTKQLAAIKAKSYQPSAFDMQIIQVGLAFSPNVRAEVPDL